jgi:hypothetical protein
MSSLMANTCHYCEKEALDRCASCGLGMCADHGNRYCQVCSGAVFSRERETGERQEQLFLQCPPKPMMKTIYLDDDDGPPECYACSGLARHVCQNCHEIYCREHAGTGGHCDQCSKAARVGNWMIAGMLVVIGILTTVAFLVNQGAAIQ